jgi:hypothetical protein
MMPPETLRRTGALARLLGLVFWNPSNMLTVFSSGSPRALGVLLISTLDSASFSDVGDDTQ